MIRTFKRITFFIAILFFVSPLFVSAATVSLSPANVVVHEGESFNVVVNINAPATREYTVKMDAVFTPGVVRLSTWNFGNQWTVLRQPGYDSFNNTLGTLTRTGGYPSGFTGTTRFGTATFTAGKPGRGTISLTNSSFIFNEASQNTYTGANVVNIEVLPVVKKEPTRTPAPTPAPKPVPVDHTFDIALVLDKPVFSAGEKVSALIHLTNLSDKIGFLEVPINYAIFDVDGNLVFTDSTLVDLKGVNKRFAYQANVGHLPPGLYSIISDVALTSLTEPAESKAHFRIESELVVEVVSDRYLNNTLLYVIAALLLGLLIGAIVARRKNKKEEELEEGENQVDETDNELQVESEEDAKKTSKTKRKTAKKDKKNKE